MQDESTFRERLTVDGPVPDASRAASGGPRTPVGYEEAFDGGRE